MAQNITLMGASYADVPSVELPKTGGGTATFTDTSDANATASDILTGKTAYVDGVKLTGTGSGGGVDPTHWQRPSEYPDYSQVTFGENESTAYLTYRTNQINSYINISIIAMSNSTVSTISIGSLSGGVFTELSSETQTGTGTYKKELTGYAQDYVVVKITGLRWLTVAQNSNQLCLEIYARFPNGSDNSLRPILRFGLMCRSLTLIDTPITSYRLCGDAFSLENFEMLGTSKMTGKTIYFSFANCYNLKYCYLNGSEITNAQNAFQGCYNLEYTDIESCNVTLNGNTNSIFEQCRKLKSLDLSGWSVNSTGCVSTFLSCMALEYLNISSWLVSGSIQNMLNGVHLKELPDIIDNGITNYNTAFQNSFLISPDFSDFGITNANGFAYMKLMESITMPSTLTNIPANAFRDSNNIKEFHFKSTTPPTLANANAFTTNVPSTSLIYVPYSEDHSILSAYQSATNWSTLASRIVEEDPS